MTARLARVGAILLALTAGIPAVASAQIYSWHDESGVLVLSDRPRDASRTTYAVPGDIPLRTTAPATQKRNGFYDDVIDAHATANNVSPQLVRAVIQAESGFNPSARSSKGAMGLMQLMPATATAFGVSNPYDPVENIRAGVAYLRRLLDRYKDNVELALAAYNAGPGAVEKYGAVPPYRETRDYVAKVKNNSGTARRSTLIYRKVEHLNGREVTRYSDRPFEGAELVNPRAR